MLRDGREVRVPVDRLAVGEMFVVRPGEKIAADALVESGASAVDAPMLTSEPVPVEVTTGNMSLADVATAPGEDVNGLLGLLLTAGDHSTRAAVPPGIGGEWSGPQPELPGAVPALPSAAAHRGSGSCVGNARRASVTPTARCPWRPAVGCSGRTQPPCGRDVPVPAIPRRPRASGSAVAALAPACWAREYPARAAAVPQSSLALPGSACRRKCPADLPLRAPTTVGTATRNACQVP